MKRVLVTGGSSPLGDVLVPRLLQEYEVIATARSSSAARRVEAHGAEPVLFDLTSGRSFPRVTVDAVVHAAGINLAGEVARAVGPISPQQIIGISSASATVDGHPRRSTVLTAEAALQACAPQTTILRPTMIYGSWRDRNIRRLWQRLRRLPVIPRVSGGGLLQPVLADDVAAAVMDVLRTPRPAVLPVGGPEPVRFDDLLHALASAMGRPRPTAALPLGIFTSAAHRRPLSMGPPAFVHALQMLLVDRVVPSPGAVGLAHRGTPLDAGMRIAIERYAHPQQIEA